MVDPAAAAAADTQTDMSAAAAAVAMAAVATEGMLSKLLFFDASARVALTWQRCSQTVFS